MRQSGRWSGWFLTAAMLAVTGGMVGCTGVAPHIANGDAALPTDEDSAAFLDRVSSEQTVNENDAMRGLLMVKQGKDSATTFAQRVETLVSKKIADSGWDYDAGRAITRGKLAYMVYQACGLPGGLILTSS